MRHGGMYAEDLHRAGAQLRRRARRMRRDAALRNVHDTQDLRRHGGREQVWLRAEDVRSLGAQCGTIDDGCGTLLDCGTCSPPKFCGAKKPTAVTRRTENPLES